jgi:hypothetical protein
MARESYVRSNVVRESGFGRRCAVLGLDLAFGARQAERAPRGTSGFGDRAKRFVPRWDAHSLRQHRRWLTPACREYLRQKTVLSDLRRFPSPRSPLRSLPTTSKREVLSHDGHLNEGRPRASLSTSNPSRSAASFLSLSRRALRTFRCGRDFSGGYPIRVLSTCLRCRNCRQPHRSGTFDECETKRQSVQRKGTRVSDICGKVGDRRSMECEIAKR